MSFKPSIAKPSLSDYVKNFIGGNKQKDVKNASTSVARGMGDGSVISKPAITTTAPRAVGKPTNIPKLYKEPTAEATSTDIASSSPKAASMASSTALDDFPTQVDAVPLKKPSAPSSGPRSGVSKILLNKVGQGKASTTTADTQAKKRLMAGKMLQ